MIASARFSFLRCASTQLLFHRQAVSLVGRDDGDANNKYEKLLMIEKDQRILELEKALDQERAISERVITMLEVDLLRSKRALTGRGILEMAFKRVNTKVNTKVNIFQRFNATVIGEKLDALRKNSDKAEFESDPFINRLLTQEASYKELYQKLSLDIHNYPWAGMDVLVSRKNLTVEEIKTLEAIAGEFRLQIYVQN